MLNRRLLEIERPIRPAQGSSLDVIAKYAEDVRAYNRASGIIIDASNNQTTLAPSGMRDKLTGAQRAARDAKTFQDWVEDKPNIVAAIKSRNFRALGLR